MKVRRANSLGKYRKGSSIHCHPAGATLLFLARLSKRTKPPVAKKEAIELPQKVPSRS